MKAASVLKRALSALFIVICVGLAHAAKADDSTDRKIPKDIIVDLTAIKPGTLKRVGWYNISVTIYHRTKSDIAYLKSLTPDQRTNFDNAGFHNELHRISKGGNDLPKFLNIDQPQLDQTLLRSKRDKYFVSVSHDPHLGCLPLIVPKNSQQAPDTHWNGGFVSPCSNDRYDFAGRLYKKSESTQNLYIPPHQYISDTKLLLGLGSRSPELLKVDFDKTDYESLTLNERLLTATFYAKSNIVEKTLKAGANPNVSDGEGNSPLHYAAAAGFEEDALKMTRQLLKSGADPNTINIYGATPLQIAVIGKPKVMAQLLKHGVQTDPFCKNGRCSRNIFCSILIPNRQLDIMEMLLKNGADPEKADYEGNSPMACAQKNGYQPTILLFQKYTHH